MADKTTRKKILDWMKGIAGEASEAIPSNPAEKGGRAWTPKASNDMNHAKGSMDAAGLNHSSGMHEQGRRLQEKTNQLRLSATQANESHRRKMLSESAGVKQKGVSESFSDRLRRESGDFYNSDKGKNNSDFVTMNGDKARNPDKKAGSGFGVKIDDGRPTKTPKQIADFISEHARGNHMAKMDDFGAGLKVKDPDGMKYRDPRYYEQGDLNWVEHPNQKAHHTKMALEGNADKIGDHVPNKKFYQDMAKNHMANKKPDGYVGVVDQLKGKTPFNAKEYYKGGDFNKSNVKSTKSKFTLDDTDLAIGAAGATGYGLGEATNAAMDQSHENGKKAGQSQSDAHSYWSRKKSGQ